MDQRFETLCDQLGAHQAVAVAFSGGADSTLLLAAARNTLGPDHVVALTAVTPYMVRQEIGDAIGISTELGVRHELVEMDMPDGMETNPPDRCYRCKKGMYGLLHEKAAELGFQTLLDASNIDDVDDYRPGLQATRELRIGSPFIACGIDKATIRAISKELGLATWRKPTNACLLTRLRFDRRVSMERLQQIEEAERFLSARGYSCVRIRCHDDVARIEVAPDERKRLLDEADAINDGIRSFGFRYVSLDLVGYQLGSMNERGD
ncbi:MAG: ATP-dependent sacrificial sulfur transferase LarE [Thiohalocapsa sp.]